jgi:hypothetical protein
MAFTVLIAEDAERDLEDIYRYIAQPYPHFVNSSRPISMRLISLVPAPIS